MDRTVAEDSVIDIVTHECGEWEEISTSEAKVTLQYMRCSVCKRWHIVPYLYEVTLPNYCPNCGTDMRDL